LYPEKFNSSDLTVERLSDEHDLSIFCCSQDDISYVDEFIHKEALRYQDENMGVTHLFFYTDEIVGFVTLSMTYIEGKDAPDPQSLAYFGNKKPPSMLIGQIGVDNKCRKRGLGRVLCQWCEGLAIKLNDKVGCRYLVLHTEKELIGFYEKCGFITKKPNKDSPLMVKKVPSYRELEK
jgi:GNAT superfamily N-acetyltransferase